LRATIKCREHHRTASPDSHPDCRALLTQIVALHLIYAGDEIAGFALVIDECPLTGRQSCFFMAVFFILKAYRRRGAGQAAVAAALRAHPGD
jgi:predicted acetyltransferase